MHIHCLGDGEPAVVFLSGVTGSGAQQAHLQRRVAASTRACTYDRPGLGYSEPTDQLLTSTESADDLLALLDHEGPTGPVVLAGESFEGILARAVYREAPERVAGAVFLDSSHEGQLHALGEASAFGVGLAERAMVLLQPGPLRPGPRDPGRDLWPLRRLSRHGARHAHGRRRVRGRG